MASPVLKFRGSLVPAQKKEMGKIKFYVAYKLRDIFELDFSDHLTIDNNWESHYITDRVSLIRHRSGGTRKRPIHNYYLVGTRSDVNAVLAEYCKKERCFCWMPVIN